MLNTQDSILQIVELNKASIKSASDQILSRINEGELNPLEVKLQLKAIESMIKELSKDVDSLARSEAEKYGAKKFEKFGATVELAETGTSYDYSNCGDSVLNDLLLKQAEIDATIKGRQEFLKTLKEVVAITDQSTGEIMQINPPVKKSTSSLKITFK